MGCPQAQVRIAAPYKHRGLFNEIRRPSPPVPHSVPRKLAATPLPPTSGNGKTLSGETWPAQVKRPKDTDNGSFPSNGWNRLLYSETESQWKPHPDFLFPFLLPWSLNLSQSHVHCLSLFTNASIQSISSINRSRETSSVNPAWTPCSASMMNSWPRPILLSLPRSPTLVPDCFDANPRPHIILFVNVSLRISERKWLSI